MDPVRWWATFRLAVGAFLVVLLFLLYWNRKRNMMDFTRVDPVHLRCAPQACLAARRRESEKAECYRLKAEKAELGTQKADLSNLWGEGYCGSECEKS